MFRKSISEHGYDLIETDKRIAGYRTYYYINHNNKNRRKEQIETRQSIIFWIFSPLLSEFLLLLVGS